MENRTGVRRTFSLFDFIGAIMFGLLFLSDLGDQPVRWLVFSGGMAAWMAVGFTVKILPTTPQAGALIENWAVAVYGVLLMAVFAPVLLDVDGWDGVVDVVAAVLGAGLLALGLHHIKRVHETERTRESR